MLTAERRLNLVRELMVKMDRHKEEPFTISSKISKNKEELIFLWEVVDLIFKPEEKNNKTGADQDDNGRADREKTASNI